MCYQEKIINMKGKLTKSINIWGVKTNESFYPLHPYDTFTNIIEKIEGNEVDFILEDFWETGLEEKIKVAILIVNNCK